MVRASIAAFALVGSLASVLSHEKGDVGVQARVGVVGDDGGGAAGRVARHVLVDVGHDRLALGLVLGPDLGGAHQANLLAGVPVELERVLRGEAGLGKNAKRLEDNDRAGGVVVGTRGPRGGRSAGGVHVSADDDYNSTVSIPDLLNSHRTLSHTQLFAVTRDTGNHGGLVKVGVRELLDSDGRVGRCELLDMLEHPVGSLGTSLRLAVASVVPASVSFERLQQ